MLVDVTALSRDQLAALYLQREDEIAAAQRQLVHHQHELATRDQQLATRDEQLASRDEQLRELEARLRQKEYEFEKLQRLHFGATRERFTVPDGQTVLPFMTDLERVTAAVEKELASVVATHTRAASKKHRGRMPLPEHLPVVEVTHTPDGDITGLKCIGQETFDELGYAPAYFFIRRHIRRKYITPEDDACTQRVIIAPMPQRPIDKCEASAELLTAITIDKHLSHIPVYRQLERFGALGVAIPPSTADNWQRLTGLLLRPLYAALRSLIPQASYLQVDETGLPVQDRAKKGRTHRGFIWVYHAPLDRLAYFDYQRGRGEVNCNEMLSDFRGYLQTDAYVAYKTHKARDGITPLACWAHARRKFFDAQSNDHERAQIALKLIGKLYDVERIARDGGLAPDARKELRLDQSLPVINIIGQWLVNEIDHTTPKSPIGAAIRYALALWDELQTYLYNGSLEIDNNLVENAIRPVALGRKNYLFAGSHDAAVNIAMYRSFFATCRLNGVDERRWLLHVLNTIGSTPADRYHTLLPQHIDRALLG